MAFDLYVFFKILKHDRLLHGFGWASMLNFYLAHHLF
jgi:hypothetical protein